MIDWFKAHHDIKIDSRTIEIINRINKKGQFRVLFDEHYATSIIIYDNSDYIGLLALSPAGTCYPQKHAFHKFPEIRLSIQIFDSLVRLKRIQ